jgi:hypothetical protein
MIRDRRHVLMRNFILTGNRTWAGSAVRLKSWFVLTQTISSLKTQFNKANRSLEQQKQQQHRPRSLTTRLRTRNGKTSALPMQAKECSNDGASLWRLHVMCSKNTETRHHSSYIGDPWRIQPPSYSDISELYLPSLPSHQGLIEEHWKVVSVSRPARIQLFLRFQSA